MGEMEVAADMEVTQGPVPTEEMAELVGK